MKITLLASTQFEHMPESVRHSGFARRDRLEYATTDADTLGEFAGRACYQSWEMPNPKTATNEGYMANIISQGHFSVLEHSSATFYIEGVSRSLTHELIRHRHLSYSELSQRYVDVSDADIVVPPAIRKVRESEEAGLHGEYMEQDIAMLRGNAVRRYNALVEDLMYRGFKRKEAREAARAVLLGGTETKIVVTGNLRAWRDMLHKRYHEAADAEIREFASLILDELRVIAPNSFQDFPEVPFS
jgi:thymidylate synthase (FAD)